MYTAMVLVCLMGNLNSCFAAVDDRGPYEDLTECFLRIDEMRKDIDQTIPNHIVRGFRCDPVIGAAT